MKIQDGDKEKMLQQIAAMFDKKLSGKVKDKFSKYKGPEDMMGDEEEEPPVAGVSIELGGEGPSEEPKSDILSAIKKMLGKKEDKIPEADMVVEVGDPEDTSSPEETLEDSADKVADPAEKKVHPEVLAYREKMAKKQKK